MLRPGLGCRAAGSRNLGGEGNLELQLRHLPGVPQVPALAASRAALTCRPLPSLPELLGSAKKVNVNFQDTDG